MASIGAAASPPKDSSPASFKEFRCTWGNCTKSFSRAEHLHRHALNHDEQRGNFTCQRCAAVFKRKDLLDRHMARHREKDAEAGGEGLGKLQTRKRLWRDSTGAVVAKRRPELEKKGSKTRRPSKSDENHDSSTYFNQQETAPISPPGSMQDHLSNGPEIIESSENITSTGADEIWAVPPGDTTIPDQGMVPPESFDFLCNASWGSLNSESLNSDILYNDLFAPDTASSFNMPFTTMSYYNWLFGTENWTDPGIDGMNGGNGKFASLEISQTNPPSSSATRGFSISDASGEYSSRSNYYDPTQLSTEASRTGSSFSSRSYSQDASNPETSAANQILAMSQMAESNLAATLGYHDTPEAAKFHAPSPRFIPTPTASNTSQEAGNRPRETRRLPFVNEAAREGVLSLISRSQPKTPDGSEITTEHPLLSLSVLQEYCDLYFRRFNVSYPLLHQATFSPAEVDPLLLTSVLLLGATYGTKESHLFAICIHDTMRAQIFGSLAFNTRPKLWMLQTILLVECFGKSRAGQLQHDMSHLFHGLLINLIRRSDCQSARCQPFDERDGVDSEHRWKAEVDAEQRRRLALLCFMWDTQHAVLFSQSLCMNAAELKLSLPWNESLWEAESAPEWHSINSTEPQQPQYLSVLKTYINPTSSCRTPPLNPLSRVLMLHGLMSVAWDLNRRDQTSLGLAITGKEASWQSLISRSYDAWKADFDIYSKNTMGSLSTPEEKQDFQRFCVASLAIYHAAHIILQVEINDLQIFAGASHIIGRPVTKTDFERSSMRIEKWCQSSPLSAATAASHSARILRDGIRKLKNWDAGDWFHYPWCLYLATLTTWAFQVCCKKEREGSEDGMGSDEEDEWDAAAEMTALVSAMTRAPIEDLAKVAGRYRKGELPRVMVRCLGAVRWAVVQEGMIVLKGLGGRK